jgi:hypothetical protein
MLRILLALQQLFLIWMLVDAIRRRAEYQWFIVLFLPFGAWVYFFMVKAKDPEVRAFFASLKPSRAPDLAELRGRFEQTPCAANRLALAQGLYEAGRFEEGAAEFGALLERDPLDREALFGRACCRIELKDWVGAASDLENLVRADPGFQDYEPWLYLAKAHWRAGNREEALARLAGLCRRSSRIDHALVYAQYLHEEGRSVEARALLEKALEDFDLAPGFIRQRDQAASKRARRLLRSLPSGQAAA